jgi:hypothetical protein
LEKREMRFLEKGVNVEGVDLAREMGFLVEELNLLFEMGSTKGVNVAIWEVRVVCELVT